MNWQRFLALIDRHRLIYGIAGALLIAMLLTAVSMALYVSSGASRLDLSRPGYERAREAVQRSDTEDEFRSTGPLDTEVANDFQERYDTHRNRLKQYDNYGSTALDDNELQIAPAAE
jgi:hypothetical protein